MRANPLQTVVALLAGAVVFGATSRGAIPPPPPATGPVFPEFRFTSQADVSRTVVPMTGSLPAELRGEGERCFLRLPGNYKGTDHERCSWDFRIKADLAVAKGIRFLLYVSNSTPIGNLAVYFHSGDGWYRAGVSAAADGAWNVVTIDKTSTSAEDSPGGWGTVDLIRFSAWRARSDMDVELGLAHMGPVGADSPILILRADSMAADSEGASIMRFAGTLAASLDELGLDVPLLSDLDVTAERLRGRKILLLPLNPSIPENVLPILRDFVEAGGWIMTFYSLPDAIADLIEVRKGKYVRPEDGSYAGMARVGKGLPGQPAFVGQPSWNVQLAYPIAGKSRTIAVWRSRDGKDTDLPAIVVSARGAHMAHVWLADDPGGKQRLLLALLGHVLPDIWQQAVTRAIDRVGVFGPYTSLGDLRRALAAAGGSSRAMTVLRDSEKQVAAARKALASKDYVTAIDRAGTARESALRAWCMSRPSAAGEFRAFWCHSAFGLAGKSWDESIAFLAEHGFNAILPNMLWGGVAYYPSHVLPVHPSVAEKGDQVAQCLAACRKYGVACHIWKVDWNMGSRTDPSFVQNMVAAKRVQKSFDGKMRERWLCPSHPANQALEIAAMLELVHNYDVDGIHFDYIRYPGHTFCFCDGCRQRFEKSLGRTVTNWPQDIRDDPDLHRAWLDWRRKNITTVVATVSKQARKIRPDIKISAAVFRNWPVDRDGVGQDWKLWCEKGYLDFVCPMDYTDSNQTFKNFVANQLEWASGKPCYPGIGLSVWRPSADPVKLIQQIGICRQAKTGGFTVFNYDANAEAVLPYLSLGTTATR